jgi:hypothetical protein
LIKIRSMVAGSGTIDLSEHILLNPKAASKGDEVIRARESWVGKAENDGRDVIEKISPAELVYDFG